MRFGHVASRSRIGIAVASTFAAVIACVAPITTQSAAAAASCSPSFSDVTSSSVFCPAIVYLAEHGIAEGYRDGTFRPKAAVSRQEIAAFIYRTAHDGTNAPSCTSKPFPDVPTTSQFCGAISWLVAQQVTAGYPDGLFHPGLSTTREGMTSFLYKYIHGAAPAPNPCSTSTFSDVPIVNQFCPYIASLRVRGVVAGYTDGTFHPIEPVSRQAMAQYLYRVLVTPLADITGVINDVSGSPLVGATVYAVPTNAADPTVVAGVTDATGRFDAPRVNGGTQRVGLLYYLCIDVPAATSSTPDQCAGGVSWDGVPAAGHVGSGANSYPALQGYTNDVPSFPLLTQPTSG